MKFKVTVTREEIHRKYAGLVVEAPTAEDARLRVESALGLCSFDDFIAFNPSLVKVSGDVDLPPNYIFKVEGA